jgi:CBS domain-containing protein
MLTRRPSAAAEDTITSASSQRLKVDLSASMAPPRRAGLARGGASHATPATTARPRAHNVDGAKHASAARQEDVMHMKQELLTELSALGDEAARLRAHLFGTDARQRWAELEAARAQVEQQLNQNAETLVGSVTATARELIRSMHEFLQVHAGLSAPARLLMTSPAMTCSLEGNVNQVAQTFWHTNRGSMPVVDSTGVLQGMLTDRDICMAAYTQGRRLADISVESAMTSCTHTATPEDSIEHVLQIMANEQVHHVPIVDTKRQVVGIISITDVARWIQGSPRQDLQEATLSAIVSIGSAAHPHDRHPPVGR